MAFSNVKVGISQTINNACKCFVGGSVCVFPPALPRTDRRLLIPVLLRLWQNKRKIYLRGINSSCCQTSPQVQVLEYSTGLRLTYTPPCVGLGIILSVGVLVLGLLEGLGNGIH